jgi:hypothetical protein
MTSATALPDLPGARHDAPDAMRRGASRPARSAGARHDRAQAVRCARPAIASHASLAAGGLARRLTAQDARIAPRSGSARRDRAQTTRRARRASAWREGQPAGWPAPAV